MKKLEELPHEPNSLIVGLVGLAFTYEHDLEMFHKKFVQMVNVENLKRYKVIEVGEQVLQDGSYDLKVDPSLLNSKELEMYCLTKRGFTSREMAVVYGMKNINSIYVKKHRLKKKLELSGSCHVEILIFGVILGIIALLVIHFFM